MKISSYVSDKQLKRMTYLVDCLNNYATRRQEIADELWQLEHNTQDCRTELIGLIYKIEKQLTPESPKD